jgi:hypothetical protein
MPSIDLWGIILLLVGAWGSYTAVRLLHLFGSASGGPGGVGALGT